MYKSVSMEKFYQIENTEHVHILDVRATKDFKQKHINGAINIPLEVLNEKYNELEKNSPYYVICYSGLKSEKACKFLVNLGFDVTDVLGGMGAWQG